MRRYEEDRFGDRIPWWRLPEYDKYLYGLMMFAFVVIIIALIVILRPNYRQAAHWNGNDILFERRECTNGETVFYNASVRYIGGTWIDYDSIQVPIKCEDIHVYNP
jgi:hypothetical protein